MINKLKLVLYIALASMAIKAYACCQPGACRWKVFTPCNSNCPQTSVHCPNGTGGYTGSFLSSSAEDNTTVSHGAWGRTCLVTRYVNCQCVYQYWDPVAGQYKTSTCETPQITRDILDYSDGVYCGP
jgi:hypothetical protein